jgi:peptidyl-dipeptidase Dcp
LPFSAPPFDKIRDEDYQPAIEAGMAQQLAALVAAFLCDFARYAG